MNSSRSNLNWALFGLMFVVAAVVARIMPHSANMTPLFAVALFTAAVFPVSWAPLIPMLALVLSDAYLGFHGGIWYTWTGMFVFVILGYSLRRNINAWNVVIHTLIGSIMFYLWTNFGVWVQSGMYPHTVAGLTASYVLALPFLRNSVIGDLAFSGVMFSAYEWGRIRMYLFGVKKVQRSA